MKRFGKIGRWLMISLFLSLALILNNGAHATSSLTRSDQPVVLTGSQIGNLQGIAPGDLVAFSFGANGWEQIPVQVDERHTMNIRNAYPANIGACSDPCYAPGTRVVNQSVYSDSKSYAGADPVLTLDADDEIALMVKDAGDQVPTGTGNPSGVTGGGFEIKLSDPIDAGTGYVYLFQRDSGAGSPLDPSAGKDYVDYHWQVLHIGNEAQTAANYKTQYRFNGKNGSVSAGNPENSWVQTAHYRRGMTSRWADNDLQIFRGGASGVDILDRHDASITFDIGCARWQGTFDAGEMAYITSTDGPIRAIRDYLGTNSGPLTERRHIFYESSEEIRVDLRVHPIPGASEIWNWSTAAVGMRYSTAFGSARVDGQGDAYLGSPAVLPQSWNWETIDRDTPTDPNVGGVSIVTYYDSNNPDPVAHSIYRDGGTGGCQNRPYRGAIWNQGPAALVSTDVGTPPYLGTYLYLTRTLHYEAPGTTNGPVRLEQDRTPLLITGSAL